MFTFVDEHLAATEDRRAPATEETISYELLKEIRFDSEDRRIDVLAELPQRLSSFTDDDAQAQQLMPVLLTAITSASFVALVEVGVGEGEGKVHHWDRRGSDASEAAPSERRVAVGWRAQTVHGEALVATLVRVHARSW